MNSYIEIKAKTLDEAITKAILELETTSENMEYEVLDKGTSGFLGIGGRPVVIKARRKEMPEEDLGAPVKKEKRHKKSGGRHERSEEKAERPDKGGNQEKKAERKPEKKPRKEREEEAATLSLDDEIEKPAKEEKPVTPIDVTPFFPKAETFLKDVFRSMNMEVETDIRAGEEVNTIEVDLKGEDMGVLIGKRGQTLDALQYLTSIVVNNDHGEYVRVKVDTENYRQRRKDTLENLANNIAAKVKRTGKAVTLEPMNAYERRIIHSVLQPNKYVNTHSEGDEPFRKVVVVPDKNFKPRPQRDRRRPYRGRRDGGSRQFGEQQNASQGDAE